MDTDVTALQLTFVPPEHWMLDKTLSPVGVRTKIENGVVYFKPAGAGMTSDVIELEFLCKTWRTSLTIAHPLTDRLLAKFNRLGLSNHSTFFEMHPAQRGWEGISLRPDHSRPSNRPYVRARKVFAKPVTHVQTAKLFHGPITSLDVERVLLAS